MELSQSELQLISVALANKISALYDLKSKADHEFNKAEKTRPERATLYAENVQRLHKQINRYKMLDIRITSGI